MTALRITAVSWRINWQHEYSNVRTFHKENGGAASARNRGISEAVGKYLLFIDGDDAIALWADGVSGAVS